MSETKPKKAGWLPAGWLLAIGAVVAMVAVAAPVGWKWHEQPSFCATCHEMKPYLDSYQTDTMLAGAHAVKKVTCLDCHEPTITEQTTELVAHVKGEYKEPLKQRDMGDDFCLGCHLENSPHKSREAVLALTAGREEELVVNPHDSHHGEFECSTCHNMHRPEPGNACASCHVAGVPLDKLPAY